MMILSSVEMMRGLGGDAALYYDYDGVCVIYVFDGVDKVLMRLDLF